MSKLKLYPLLAFVFIFSGIDAQAEEDIVARGAKIFNDNCTRCHNARPAGEFDEREWSVIIPHMREKAHMSGTEALAVEAFIAITFTAGKQVNKTIESEAETGEALISKFACAGCHKIGAEGGMVGPNLSGVVQRMGRKMVFQKLLDPTFNNSASAMPAFPLNEKQAEKIIDALSLQ